MKADAPPTRFQYAVLFDLDGVIINTRAATLQALATVASRELSRPITTEQVAPHVGLRPADALAALGVAHPQEAYARHFDTALAQALGDVEVFQPVLDGMADLSRRGAAIGLITSQARRRIATLVPTAVTDLLDVAIASDDVQVGKPDPEGIHLALARVRVPPQRAMYIGDTSPDVMAASRAGVLAVGVGWGYSSADQLQRVGADLVLTDPGQVGGGLLYLLAGREAKPARSEAGPP